MTLDEMYKHIFGPGSNATGALKMECAITLLRDMHQAIVDQTEIMKEIRDRLPGPANVKGTDFSNLPGWN